MARDGATNAKLNAIIAKQKTCGEFEKRADFIIYNNDLCQLDDAMKPIMAKLAI